MNITDQIYRCMPDEEYRAIDRFSKHESDDFSRNPYAYFKRKEAGVKDEPTEAMRLGTAIHAAILDPVFFESAYVMMPESIKVRRGKEWEAFASENEGKEILKAADYATIYGMAESVNANATAREMLLRCPAQNREFSMFATIADVQCKGRADIVIPEDGIISDLKSTSDASPDAFVRQASDLAYDVQAAWYLMLAEQLNVKASCFTFIAVEKTFPWTVGVYHFSRNSEFIRAGEQEVYKRLSDFRRWKDGSLEHPAGWLEYDLQLPPWNKRLQALRNPTTFSPNF